MNNQTPLEKEIEQQIYGLRLLVLAECESCGESKKHFHQVWLNKKQFKAVSDICFVITKEKDDNNMEEGLIQASDEIVPMEPFEGMADFYE